MPRPGPRPYECVRRAWHSDRHQPMRGSIIQQIFRVVHDSHGSATKKNKEWLEKLPIVVLKAEEIMYSKANSEAEYMDPGTLWERVNDAINTIIRRDESTETGDLLPPCVEAALNLGCVPVRASRSQRHANPRSYLGQRTEEQIPHSGNQSSSQRPADMNSPRPITELSKHVMPNSTHSDPATSFNFPLSSVKVPPSTHNQYIPVENTTSVNVGSVYPLYYGTHFPIQPEKSQFPFQILRNSNSIIVGTPVFQSIAEPAKMGCFQSPVSREREENFPNRVSQVDFGKKYEKVPDTGFDLSLRLGSFEDPSVGREKLSVDEIDGSDLSNSQGSAPKQNKEFSFFPVEIANDPSGFGSSRRSFEGEGQSAEAAGKKRKAPFNINLEDEHIFSRELRFSQFTGQMKRPGL